MFLRGIFLIDFTVLSPFPFVCLLSMIFYRVRILKKNEENRLSGEFRNRSKKRFFIDKNLKDMISSRFF